MRVLIVAKTRQGSGACVGGIATDGRSIRLIPEEPLPDRHNMEYQIGDVWDVEVQAPEEIVPPHTENRIVLRGSRVRRVRDLTPHVERFMPPHVGGPEGLFEGLLQAGPGGALVVRGETGTPGFSTQFWRPDQPLTRQTTARRLRYRYPTPDGGRTLVFVGFQDPPPEIPAGALLRVSLSHWWRPEDEPDAEPRCWAQLSGWIGLSEQSSRAIPDPLPASATAPPADLTAVRAELKRVFGYDEFRPLQESVIGALLSGRDALAVMPTGSGKSLCYQLPALVLPGPTVVVSPLISLMQDQVDQLAQAGVPAVFLNSTLSLEQYGENCRMLRQGRARMVYMAPETLLRPETLVLMEECRIPLFAIDEAHCISEWGHDFRPEYRQLRPVRNRLAGARCLALTATATPRVQEDIQKLLGIPASQSFVAGFDRPNLLLRAQTRLKDGGEQLLQFVKTHPDEAGILYCGTRELVDTLTHYLQEAGFRALPYHAGLPDPVRRENQRQFIRDECQIVVATVAFGMGINKPDVRWILHFNLPDCLETYYQQVGRAGRDGLPSECLLLHARGDGSTHFHFIEQGAEQERSGRLVRLQAMQRYANAARCRRAVLLSYFGDPEPAEPCGICDNCRAAGRPMRDVTDEARLFLRAVQESRQRFGLVQILRILRGSKAQEVVRRQLDQLPVHGAGKEQSEEFWRTVAQALLEEGLLEQDQEYGVLKVTARSRELESGRRVQVPETEPEVAATVQPKQAPADPALFETLRKLRREIAAEHGVAPYMVLSDRSLLDLCARRPRTRAALLQVHGIGEHKATVFGEPFLAAIRDFGGEPEEAPEATPAVETGAPRPAQRAAVRRRDAVAAFQEGMPLAKLESRFDVSYGTLVNYLELYFGEGGELDPDRLLQEAGLSPAQYRAVAEQFAQHSAEFLSPIYHALEGAVTYDQLRLFRLARGAIAQRRAGGEPARSDE